MFASAAFVILGKEQDDALTGIVGDLFVSFRRRVLTLGVNKQDQDALQDVNLDLQK